MTKEYHISLTLILAFCSISVFSQRTYETNPDRKRGFNWMFGENIWLDFKTNPPTLKSGSQLSAIESAATYSDTAGNLLFYSDGITVWNSNHKIIKNGTNLGGNHSSSQGCIFIKHPSNDSIVYLFTTDAQGGSKGFQVNTIYIKPNIDSSIIIEKNKVLLNESCESIAATQHQNGIFTWVTVHSKFGNTFYAYLINENGLVECPITSNQGYIHDGDIFSCQTMNVFSDDSKYFAMSTFSNLRAQLLFFDNLTGKFKLSNQFLNLNVPTGVAFSNNNNFLYLVERGKQINQIDMINFQNNIIKTNINNAFFINHLSKTPYNEIFVNILDSFYIGSIKKPDLRGISANFNLKELYQGGKKIKYGFNNFNNSYLYTTSVNFSYKINCQNNSINFKGQDTFNADLHLWQIKKKESTNVFNTIGTSKKINYFIVDSGLYIFRYVAIKGSRKDTVEKTIALFPKIKKDILGNDTAFEAGQNFNKLLKTANNSYCQSWYFNDTLISNETMYNATKFGKYICKTTTTNFCEFFDTITIGECNNNLQIPKIIRKNDTLYVDEHFNYDKFTWFRNNQKIENATNSSLKLNDTGIYRVLVSKINSCNVSSDSFKIYKLKINDNFNNNIIYIFPNPTNNIINVNFENYQFGKLKLYDMFGKLVFENELTTNQNTLFLHNLKPGLYLLNLSNKILSINQKIIKL